VQIRCPLLASVIILISGIYHPVLAGMPGVSLSDFGQLSLQAISFFAIVFVICGFVVQRLWNGLQSDFPRLPRLSFGKAAGVVTLWGMLFVLVLTMISGARELMTPGAWVKKGSTYRLADTTVPSVDHPNLTDLTARREMQIQRLWSALVVHAARNKRRFPSVEEALAMDEATWRIPDREATRYLYVPGRSVKPRRPRFEVCIDVTRGKLTIS
jgi:hypothetical protein